MSFLSTGLHLVFFSLLNILYRHVSAQLYPHVTPSCI